MTHLPIEASAYDPATKCDDRARRDVVELRRWLEENVRGVFWGSAGNPQALARRMGVEELIWDCEYWAAGMPELQPYRPCYGKRGKPRKHVNTTVAHRDHIHLGMTKAGAAGKTSFWRGHTG